MGIRLYCNFLSALIVWVTLEGIQGHPPRRLEDQRSVEDNVSTTEAILSNRSEPQLPQPRIRKSLAVNYEPRVKSPDAQVAHSGRIVQSDGRIIFPSDPPSIAQVNYMPSAEGICANSTFCEHPPGYPDQIIRSAIKLRSDLKSLSTSDLPVLEIGQRINSDSYGTDVPLCKYEERVIFPKSAQSQDNQWLYVVNDETFPQGILIEQCINENYPCEIINDITEGYSTSCKQKYVYRKMAAVAPDGGLHENFFRFAASCCCHVSFSGYHAAMRIDTPVGDGKPNLQSPAPATTASSRANETEKK